MFVIPLILLTNHKGIRKSLPLFNGKKLFPKFIASCISVFLIVTVGSLVYRAIEKGHSTSYIASQPSNDNNDAFVSTPKVVTASKQVALQVNTEMTTTLSVGDKFTPPTSIVAKGTPINKTVAVTWSPVNVDMSVPKTTILTGVIGGYDKAITYTVNVLPATIAKTFDNITTYDSKVEYTLNTKGMWMIFEITKGTDTERQYVKTDKAIDVYLYLNFGQGDYTIVTYDSVTPDQYGNYYTGKTYTVSNKDTRDMSYLFPSNYVQSTNSEIVKLAGTITENCYNDFEKTSAIHDWVARNIKYNVAETKGKIIEYSAVDTLNAKSSICNGYANLTAALNRAVGIKTKVVTGNLIDNGVSGLHNWNETYVNNQWIPQDTTLDAGYINIKNGKFVADWSRVYFNSTVNILKNHKVISSHDHD